HHAARSVRQPTADRRIGIVPGGLLQTFLTTYHGAASAFAIVQAEHRTIDAGVDHALLRHRVAVDAVIRIAGDVDRTAFARLHHDAGVILAIVERAGVTVGHA